MATHLPRLIAAASVAVAVWCLFCSLPVRVFVRCTYVRVSMQELHSTNNLRPKLFIHSTVFSFHMVSYVHKCKTHTHANAHIHRPRAKQSISICVYINEMADIQQHYGCVYVCVSLSLHFDVRPVMHPCERVRNHDCTLPSWTKHKKGALFEIRFYCNITIAIEQFSS